MPKTVKRKLTKKKTTVAKKVKRKAKKVSYIPKGYNTITPYLIVSNGKKAIEFYTKLFGAKQVMRLDQPGGKIGHAELKIGDTKIMLADQCPEMGALAPEAFSGSPVSIHLYVKDVDSTSNKAAKLGAKIIRPAQDMFYGDRSCGLQDPFGHIWYVSTHIENVTPAQMRKRAAELFGHKK